MTSAKKKQNARGKLESGCLVVIKIRAAKI